VNAKGNFRSNDLNASPQSKFWLGLVKRHFPVSYGHRSFCLFRVGPFVFTGCLGSFHFLGLDVRLWWWGSSSPIRSGSSLLVILLSQLSLRACNSRRFSSSRDIVSALRRFDFLIGAVVVDEAVNCMGLHFILLGLSIWVKRMGLGGVPTQHV